MAEILSSSSIDMLCNKDLKKNYVSFDNKTDLILRIFFKLIFQLFEKFKV